MRRKYRRALTPINFVGLAFVEVFTILSVAMVAHILAS